MKKIAAIILLLLCIPSYTFAATEQKDVWFDVAPGQSGSTSTMMVGGDILIYARINNLTKETITYSVSFSVDGAVIGTRVAPVPGYAQMAVSIPWILPEKSTEVTAIITKAVDKDKKELENLVGTIGTVTLTNAAVIVAPDISSVRGFTGTVVTKVEAFRLKELQYFSALLIKSRGVLATTTLKDVSTMLQPDPAPAVVVPEKKSNQIGGYAQLIYATGGKALFSHKATFYVVVVLLVLFILRFIVSRLF
jgi:hypothetical protein